MPNIITHTLFADEVNDILPYDFNKKLLEIGSNGPDFLFFHGCSPKHISKDVTLRHLGSIAHQGHINDFYKQALKTIREEKDEDTKENMISYISGHLCHWALDCTVHPYVFYRTGNCKNESGWWHHRFESVLDSIVLKVKREQTIKDFKAYQICECTKEQAKAIVRIYMAVSRNVFSLSIHPYQLWESLQDWYTIQKLLYDASGRKWQTIYDIETLLHKENMLSGLIVPNEPEDPFDTCNLLHKQWMHPCDDTKVYTSDFFELYEKAKELACQVIPLFIEAIDSKEKEEILLNTIGNRNYNLGISDNRKMKFFDLVFE